MKKYLIILIAALTPLISTTAGERDWHLGFSPDFRYNPFARSTLVGSTISIEKEAAHRRFWGLKLGLSSSHYKNSAKEYFDRSELVLLPYYKVNMGRGKNHYSSFLFGPEFGSSRIGVTFGLHFGFEHSITLRNRIKFYIAQDNILSFRSDDRFVSGLSIGMRVPLNK